MSIVIEPYRNVGPLIFGMDQQDLISTMGISSRTTLTRSGSSVLWYDELNAIMENDRLVEVGIGPQALVSICGIRPFIELNGFFKLCKIDGDPREVLGSIVLRNIGVSLSGFHDHDESQKGITAFVRGRWDVLEPKMKPFTVLTD